MNSPLAWALVFHVIGFVFWVGGLLVTTTVPGYLTVEKQVQLRAMAVDTLRDTIRPGYTGFPAVRGIRISQDTVSGTIALSWAGAACAARPG